MLQELRALWARHSILEAKTQQEQGRSDPDPLRLSLLKRMQLTVRREIAAIENREAA